MEEEWKEIKMNRNYLISNKGRFKNRKTDNILKAYKTNSGYLQINFTSQHRHGYIHRLIAEAFINNKYDDKCINHKDGNKLNNDISNLEWCSYSYNQIHSHRELGNKVHNIKLTKEKANEIRKLLGRITQRSIAKLYDVSPMVISRIKHNKQLEYKT